MEERKPVRFAATGEGREFVPGHHGEVGWGITLLAKTLVATQIEDGRRLLEALAKKHLRARAAFWYFEDYKEDWRLVIQLPLVDQVYHQKAYLEVEKIRRSLQPPIRIKLSHIALQSSESPLVSVVRRVIKETKADYRNNPLVHVGQTVNVQFIDDVYVYTI